MKKNLLVMALFLILPFGLWAQGITVKGTVSDKTGSLPGVSILEKGTTNGVATNIDGQYELTVSDGNAVLVFSFMGYKTQEIPLDGRKVVDVMMEENTEVLEEVVVTGYGGTQRRSKVTSSIVKVDNEMLMTGVHTNPSTALSGAIPGVRVTNTSGRPGATSSIVLRGGTNWDGTGDPLIIVDGQVRGSMSEINPMDIGSMEVLKDAAATAIYGARANNGVILITTKRGSAGRTSVNFSAKLGLDFLNDPYEFCNAEDYLYWARTGVKNAADQGYTNLSSLDNVGPYGTGNRYMDESGNILDGNKDSRAVWSTMFYDPKQHAGLLQQGWKTMTDPVTGKELIYKEFDYKKAAFKTPATTQDYNISMSGGNENGNYYAGIGWYHQDGLPIKTFYERLTATFNGDYKIREYLHSSTSLSFADAKWRDTPVTNEANYWGRMLSAPPTMRGTNADGELLVGHHFADGNPQATNDKFIRKNNSTKFTLGQTLKLNFTPDLYLQMKAMLMYDESFAEQMNKDYLVRPGNVNTQRYTKAEFDRTVRQTYTLTAGYAKTFAEKHSVDVLGGFEFYEAYRKGFNAAGEGAPTDDFLDLGLTTSEKDKRAIDSWHTRSRIMSVFGKLNYDYDGKYLFSFTFREDGYSKLVDNRWGFFPGVSAGWNMHREKFFPESWRSVVSFAKFRGSYGLNGNVSFKDLGDYTLQGAYGSNRFNGELGYLLTTVANPKLKWEKSHTFEVALDLGLFENRINTSFTYYNRTTMDKIANINLPTASGVGSIMTNNGEMRNTGFEWQGTFRIIQDKSGWNWTFSANASYNKNKVIKLPDNGLLRNRQDAIEVWDGKTGKTKWVGGYQEGQEPGDMYAYKAEGIYQDEEDIRKHKVVQDEVVSGYGSKILLSPDKYASMPNPGAYSKIEPGDVKWKDVNGDGIIDSRDRVKVGRSVPRWTGGLNTNLSWKGIRLFARMDFATGHTQFDYINSWFLGMMQGTFNVTKDVFNTWTPENRNAKYPMFRWADQLGKNNYRTSTLLMYDASYLAFRELSLSYDLPAELLNKVGMKGVTLSVTGQNLGYWTKSPLYSPEPAGSQNSGYALPRTVIFGINVTL